jgi:hypothetical protein
MLHYGKNSQEVIETKRLLIRQRVNIDRESYPTDLNLFGDLNDCAEDSDQERPLYRCVASPSGSQLDN